VRKAYIEQRTDNRESFTLLYLEMFLSVGPERLGRPVHCLAIFITFLAPWRISRKRATRGTRHVIIPYSMGCGGVTEAAL
jgi:hypothetical protein